MMSAHSYSVSAVIRQLRWQYVNKRPSHIQLFFQLALPMRKNTFVFLLLNCLDKHKLIDLPGRFRLVQTWRGLSVFTMSHYYSPGAPKPMDVIRCPLTSMCSNSGDFTTHGPSHALTWWKRHLELTSADMLLQNISRCACLPLCKLLSVMVVFLRCRVTGYISGKSAADKRKCLLDKITRHTIGGSHCTSVQVSIDKSLKILLIQLKKKLQFIFWDPKIIQKSPETEATWRDSNSSTEHTIIPNLIIYNALLKTIDHLCCVPIFLLTYCLAFQKRI